MKEIIRTFDTTLLTKAGKVDFYELRKEQEELMTKEDVEKHTDEIDEKINDFKGDIRELGEKFTLI